MSEGNQKTAIGSDEEQLARQLYVGAMFPQMINLTRALSNEDSSASAREAAEIEKYAKSVGDAARRLARAYFAGMPKD